MKRFYFLLAVLILLAAMSIACSKQSGQTEETVGSSAPSSGSTEQLGSSEVASTPTLTTLTTAEGAVSSIPATAVPETTIPETTVPATTVPVTIEPVTTAPVTIAPVTTAPTTTATVTTKPITTATVTTKPVTTLPVTTTEPVTKRPSTLVTPEVEPDKDDYVKVSDYIPSIHVDLRYSGKNNLAGTPIYSFSDAYLRYGTVRRLAAVQEDLLKDGYSLLIWDAYRPLAEQLCLSEVIPGHGTSPVLGTTAYNYGDTLSVSIIKSDGSTLTLPYDFDYWDQPEVHDNSSKAKANARRLSDAMTAHGFEPYLEQWYRFTDRDDYSLDRALTIGEKGVESCPEWVAVCDNSLSVREKPLYDAETVIKIPRGKKVKLIFFQADFAYVQVDGQYGYILAAYLARSLDGEYQNDLEVVKPRENYSYEQMQTDLAALAEKYPDRLHLSSIGKSEEGRDLTLAILGNVDAEKKVFLQSTIHAREYIVTELTMGQIDYMLHHQDEYLPSCEMTIGELLDLVCFYIVPMSNPDGVNILQTGKVPEIFAGTSSADKASLWKANAKGIDLNANFDADWDQYGNAHSTGNPGYMGYKGTAPECAAESKALADYLRTNQFDLILSYHTSGSIIYYTYGGNECAAVNAKNFDLSRRLSIPSGFTLNGQPSSSTAGLKDWAIQTLKTPSLTIEFAAWNSPVMQREFDQIWARSRDMLAICGKWVLDQES